MTEPNFEVGTVELPVKLQEKNGVSYENYRKRWRWLFLITAAICELAFMYNNTSIMTLQPAIQMQFGLNDFKYSQILTFQNLPGIFIPILAGFFADRYGSALIFALGLLVNYAGQFVSTYAVSRSNFWLLVLGQLLIAAGMQTLVISKNKMFKSWFTSKEMGKAVSICMIVDSAAMMLCDLGYPHLFQSSQSLFLPYMVGSGIILAALPFGVAQIILHKKLTKRQSTQEDAFEVRLSFCGALKAIKDFPKTFWLLILYSIASFVSFFCTKSFSTRYLMTQFDLSIGSIGVMLAVVMVISAVCAIIIGIILDKYGRLALAGMFGALLVSLGIGINMVLPHCHGCVTGGIPLTIMSLGGVINQLVPVIATMRLIKGPSLGVGLGFSALLTSAAMMGFPSAEGILSDRTFETSGYYWVFLLNVLIGIIAAIFGFLIFIVDYRGPKKLLYASDMMMKKPNLAVSATETDAKMLSPDLKILTPLEKVQSVLLSDNRLISQSPTAPTSLNLDAVVVNT